MSPLKTTKLSAINTMLATIGEAPLNSLEDTELLDGIAAIQTLDEITLEVLGEGWDFNTSDDFAITISPEPPFNAIVPSNAIQVFIKDDPEGVYKMRGDRVFDDKRQSFSHPGRRPFRTRVIWSYPFDDLPEAAKGYIKIRSARIFQDRFVGSDSIHSYTRSDEMFAYSRLKRYETRSSRPNLLRNSTAARILRR